jgi:hypothetical protein
MPLTPFLDQISVVSAKKAVLECDQDPKAFFKKYGYRATPRNYWIKHPQFGDGKYPARPILAAAYKHEKNYPNRKHPNEFAGSRIGSSEPRRTLSRLGFKIIPI